MQDSESIWKHPAHTTFVAPLSMFVSENLKLARFDLHHSHCIAPPPTTNEIGTHDRETSRAGGPTQEACRPAELLGRVGRAARAVRGRQCSERAAPRVASRRGRQPRL